MNYPYVEAKGYVDPERVEFTKRALALDGRYANWKMGDIMPMRDYTKRLFDDDRALGVVFKANPLKIYVGCIGLIDWRSVQVIEFDSVDHLIESGWLCD